MLWCIRTIRALFCASWIMSGNEVTRQLAQASCLCDCKTLVGSKPMSRRFLLVSFIHTPSSFPIWKQKFYIKILYAFREEYLFVLKMFLFLNICRLFSFSIKYTRKKNAGRIFWYFVRVTVPLKWY